MLEEASCGGTFKDVCNVAHNVIRQQGVFGGLSPKAGPVDRPISESVSKLGNEVVGHISQNAALTDYPELIHFIKEGMRKHLDLERSRVADSSERIQKDMERLNGLIDALDRV